MTAAGTVAPAKVLVLGAGVAGLQAIATARRLGAVVSAFDTRPVVKEQVQSLGAAFVEIELAVSGAAGLARLRDALTTSSRPSSSACSSATSPIRTSSSRPRSSRGGRRRG